jgi:hypothetical protein
VGAASPPLPPNLPRQTITVNENIYVQHRQKKDYERGRKGAYVQGLNCSLRHWKQIPNLFIAPLPTAVCNKLKAADRAVCTVGNLFPNCQHL